jgi:peptide/nickel transport system ATP-binding protein
MLDASTRIDVLNLLADLSAQGLSILFITHDLSLGYYISGQSVILYRGSVVEMGTSQRVYANPLHPYTVMLMACVPRLDRPWEDVDVELKAKQKELPTGCVYYGRCPHAYAKCLEKPPALQVEPDHLVACWKAFEQLGIVPTSQPTSAEASAAPRS